MHYTFKHIEKCDMCGADVRKHKVLGKRLSQSQGRNPRKKTGVTTTVCKCTNCGLIYSNPTPIPVDLGDHYGILPEDYWTEEKFRVNESQFSHHVTRIKQLMDFKNGMKSLDIGSGLGHLMIALETAGFDAHGLEPSKPFREYAISKMGISADNVALTGVEKAEYDANSFDFISFGAVLEHLYNPSDCLKKALSWVKPGGLIQVEVPSADWFISKLVNRYYRLTFTDYVTNLSPMLNPFHLYEFTLKSFQENGKLNGYAIPFHQYFVCKTFLPQAFDTLLRTYMKRTNSGMELEVWLRKSA